MNKYVYITTIVVVALSQLPPCMLYLRTDLLLTKETVSPTSSFHLTRERIRLREHSPLCFLDLVLIGNPVHQ